MLYRENLSLPYQLFMLVLSLFAIVTLAIEALVALDPETRTLLEYADNALCAIFLLDFILSMWRAENRWKYLATWGWLDLLSSIPTLDVARWGRVARIARVLRVLRGLRATRVLTSAVLHHRARNTFLAAALVSLLLIVFCSIAILQFETHPSSNIRTADDALWWAFATITTVGYGDRYPVTVEGRLTAAILMSAGVGLFGALSGFLAAWFMSPDKGGAESELALLRAEIAELRELLASRQ